MSSIAVERVFDGLACVGLLGVGLLASDLPPGVVVGGVSVARAAQVAGVISLAGAGGRGRRRRVSPRGRAI